MSVVLSVNLGRPEPNPAGGGSTGIGKRPVDVPVQVRAPGPRPAGGGLVGDYVADGKDHGGDDQAVYAYAREDLDEWARELGRDLSNGLFGENLTTLDVDVTGARIGERWRIGPSAVVQVTRPRIPCSTFAARIGEPRWQKRFTQRAAPGAYLSVVEPGEIRGGDELTVERRPDHDITIGLAFRALTTEAELLPRLLETPDLATEVVENVRRRLRV